MLVHLLVRSRSFIKLVENDAVLDKQHPVRMAGRFQAVCDHKNGLSHAVDLLENTEQAVRRFRIQRSGRLVSQHDLRVGDQSAGNCRTLFLPAGYLIRVFFQQGVYPKHLGKREQTALDLFWRPSGKHQRQRDIIIQGKGIQQVEILKYKAEVFPPESGQLTVRDRAKLHVI